METLIEEYGGGIIMLLVGASGVSMLQLLMEVI